jgi:hypothetical protein
MPAAHDPRQNHLLAALPVAAFERITVVDRAGLEARTCECYAVVKKECDRLLPDSTAA